MRTYRKIAEIRFLHQYYTSGVLDGADLAMHLSPETERLLANYRLMLKLKPARIELVQECETDDDGRQQAFIDIDHDLQLSIVLEQRNKLLFSFSELPFVQMARQAFYFSNRHLGQAVEGRLSRGQFVGADDICWLLPKSAAHIALDWNEPWQLRTAQGQVRIADAPQEVFAQQLAFAPDGYYELWQQGQRSAAFVLLKKRYSEADLGLIDLMVPAHSPLGPMPTYSIEFDVRRLPWQYQVYERYNSIKNIEIVDDKSQVQFREQASIDANGQRSKLFVSTQPIALCEVNRQTFRVVSPANGRAAKVWIERLPVPRLSNLVHADPNGKALVFKEYVYL